MRDGNLRRLLTTFLVTGAALISAAEAADVTKPKGVIELFTSQGCYSCPPADKLIGKFSRDGDYLALSWHVDYWDYLGWKDTFASPKNTERQQNYARMLQERQVYTPQAVLNGRVHEVGSREGKIKSLFKQLEQGDQDLSVPIDVVVDKESVNIRVAPGAVTEKATLHLVFFNKLETVKIERGENGGKKLQYHNVVHATQPLGLIGEDGYDMGYPTMEMAKSGFDSCALILQTHDSDGNPSAIIGATVLSDL
ncbi:MAG: DUF1223 domain-containing protein [Rhizobiaceae bacterium]